MLMKQLQETEISTVPVVSALEEKNQSVGCSAASLCTRCQINPRGDRKLTKPVFGKSFVP